MRSKWGGSKYLLHPHRRQHDATSLFTSPPLTTAKCSRDAEGNGARQQATARDDERTARRVVDDVLPREVNRLRRRIGVCLGRRLCGFVGWRVNGSQLKLALG